jgi:cobalt-zinc-cadmium resistance protein CzcA
MAQYGVNTAQLNQLLKTAFAGQATGVVYEGERRYDLVVRLDSTYRQNLDHLKALAVSLPNGGSIPLQELAQISQQEAAVQISRDDTKRRITIGINVRNRDIESLVAEVSQKIEKKVALPTGYYFKYGGAFENLEAAKARLSIAVPVALLLIFMLLYFTFNSLQEATLIFTAVPFSAIGGIFALWLTGIPFSISAGVGFIALFGVAVLNGIVLIGSFNQLESEGLANIEARIEEGVAVRFRPVIMTALVASLGFLPMALSNSAGSEVQKPLAIVVIGGLVSATVLTLIVLPVLYALLKNRNKTTL